MESSLQRIRLEADYSEVQRLGTNVDVLLRLPSISADPAVIAARTILSQKQIAFDNLKQRYKEKHYKYIEAQNELRGLERMLSNDVLAAAQNIKTAIASAKATEQALHKQFDEQQNAARELSSKLNESTNNFLAREIELERTIHDKVMQRLKEAAVTSDLFYNPISVFQTAEVPLKPAKPDQIKAAAIGFLGSLALGIALALALGLVDTSLKSIEETEHFLNLPVLSTVPRVHTLASAQSQIVMDSVDATSGAESFRSLRTSVSVLGKDKELRSILFTSALPGEGKTFCAVNYAVSLAQQGLKTVLIDCDLRRPMVAESIPCQKKDGLGLSEYLRLQIGNEEPKRSPKAYGSEADLSFAELRSKRRADRGAPLDVKPSPGHRDSASVVDPLSVNGITQKTDIENLFFIPAGNAMNNPSELLGQHGLSQLLGELLRRYDRVVVDSAPVFGVSDTVLISNRVHALCLVIRANRTPRKAVVRAVEMLHRVDACVLGVVLNGHASSRLSGYADHYYDYGYEPKKAS
jgi:Mrp family chromosome partitioning ATPase